MATHSASHIEKQASPVPEKQASEFFHAEEVETSTATTESIDIHNTHAVKGDDSDGKIDWNWKQRIAVMSLIGLYTGAQLPVYFTAACLRFIAAEIGGLSAQAWLPISYTLALAAIVSVAGYLQDLVGRRWICLTGSVLIIVGCVVFGTTHTFVQGIFGMVLCGCGAAIGEMTALAGTSELVPVKQRPYYMAALSFVTLPFVPNILEGQLLATYATWRWGIWICLIWNGICLVGLVLTYFPVAQRRASRKDVMGILSKIDYAGIVLSITGLTLFLVALQSGGYYYPWKTARVLAPLIIGILLLIGFVLWEWKGAKCPMVPGALFAGQNVVTVTYIIAAVAVVYRFEPDPIQIGLKGFATGAATMAGAVLGNTLLPRVKSYVREMILVFLTLMVAFTGAFAVATPDNPKLTVALATIGCFGLGGIIVPISTISLLTCPDVLIGTCAALSLAVRAVGAALGYSIYFAVFQSRLAVTLPTRVAEYAIAAGLPSADAVTFVGTFLTSPEDLANMTGITVEIIQGATYGSQWGYADAFKYIWYTSIPFGVLTIVTALFLPNVEKYITNRIAGKIAH